jgi:hydrogenase maturation protease
MIECNFTAGRWISAARRYPCRNCCISLHSILDELEVAVPCDDACPQRINLLIVGLGNALLMDDGVGVHAVRELQKDPVKGAVIVEVGCAVLDALHLFEAADRVIALDAVQAGGPPGTVYELTLDGVGGKGPEASMHELDLGQVFRMLPEERRPVLSILGVEPAVIAYGLELSPPVRAALPEFLKTVRRTAASLGVSD